MIKGSDKQIIVDKFCGYDGPMNASFALFIKENDDPIYGDAEIEQISRELEIHGKSQIQIVKQVKLCVKFAQEFKPEQLIETEPWTDDDYFDVAQSVAKRLLSKIEKKLRIRGLECRFCETGVIEFRIR